MKGTTEIKKIRRMVYGVMSESAPETPLKRIFNYLMFLVITVNIIFVNLETIPNLSSAVLNLFYAFYGLSMLIFIIEYILRVWFSVEDNRYKYKYSIKGRIKYILSPYAIIDLLVLIPFLIPDLIPADYKTNALRLLKLFIILKLIRYSQSLQGITNVFYSKKKELAMLIYMLFFLLVLVSTLMYYVENKAQPESFSSIPATMWWGVITLTTVGYGDMYPITPLGKVLGALVAILGIGLFALPAGILASGFYEQFSDKKEEENMEDNQENERQKETDPGTTDKEEYGNEPQYNNSDNPDINMIKCPDCGAEIILTVNKK
ncbi:ion transporter [Methanoplanus limicola]|uniref:Ion transport protein n=1 Tax=Methanoplanus limicola DSM 2279 TaxID=937775 RepID=H1Z029_9EURY|nr:ion transporter [Methanoplanus limicola]EHQ35236.1 Ion transport protein [Methanoplanus limicola DSM 2279]